MRAAPLSKFRSLLTALAGAAAIIAAISCGGGDSTGPGGGGVAISPSSDSIALGSSRPLTATVNGSPTSNVFWSSENNAIATVSTSGVAPGFAPGAVRLAPSRGGWSPVWGGPGEEVAALLG